MKLSSVLDDSLRGDTIKFLELTNHILSKEVEFLHEQIRSKDEISKALMQRIGILEKSISDVKIEDFNPIPGYKSTRTRIAEAEARDREEYYKAQEDDAKQVQ
jgi:hypothetical protein